MTARFERPGVVVVDLAALARNYGLLRERAAPAECGAVVKADAYGLGMQAVATRLAREGCRRFFVATAEEGARLRGFLPDATIFVFGGLGCAPAADFVRSKLTPVLNTIDEIAQWRAHGRPAALHVDTGMNRLGLGADDVEALAQRAGLAELEIECLMTHLACADERDNTFNARQLRVFDGLKALLPSARTSIANSAGVFLGPEFCGDLVRPGIALYGGNPFSDRASPVEPVASLLGRVLQVRELGEDASVGYGATHRAMKGARVATVGVGYADGYPRAMGNRGEAGFESKRLPVVGRVSMDLIGIDVSSLDAGEPRVGDYVELFGKGTSVDEIAAACGTIAYEILTGLGTRLERVYVE